MNRSTGVRTQAGSCTAGGETTGQRPERPEGLVGLEWGLLPHAPWEPDRRAAGRTGHPGRSIGRSRRSSRRGASAAFWGMCGSSSCRISAASRLSLLPPSSTPLSTSGLRSERSRSPLVALPPWQSRQCWTSAGRTFALNRASPCCICFGRGRAVHSAVSSARSEGASVDQGEDQDGEAGPDSDSHGGCFGSYPDGGFHAFVRFSSYRAELCPPIRAVKSVYPIC